VTARHVRPPRVVLVVACSRRKHLIPPADLLLSSINAPPEQRLVEWKRRIREVEARRRRAHDLYAGDHWRAVCEAYRLTRQYSSRAELWVISAGYGLISSDKLIKPYGATFATHTADSVWRGPADGDRERQLRDWWRALPHDAALSDLVEGEEGALVIAAGTQYVTVLGPDLLNLVQSDGCPDRLSVISGGSKGQHAALPVTGSLRSAVGGTHAALNARLLRLLAADAPTHRWKRSAMDASLRRLNDAIPRVTRPARIAMTDSELAIRIQEMRNHTPQISRTTALRHLRNGGIACGQGRFAAIWAGTVGASGHP
jgi:hypothetical protein